MKPTTTKTERRDFLRQAAMGGLSLTAIAAGLGVSEHVAARMLSVKTTSHVDQFVERIGNARISNDAIRNLEALTMKFQAAFDADAELYQRAAAMVASFGRRLSAAGGAIAFDKPLPHQMEQFFAGAVAAACNSKSVSGSMDDMDVGSMLDRSERGLKSLEAGFLDNAIVAIDKRADGDVGFANTLAAAGAGVNSSELMRGAGNSAWYWGLSLGIAGAIAVANPVGGVICAVVAIVYGIITKD